ncbi:FAD-binding oxidoreductase [Micromonospora sp. NPDC049171]|uniref:FAD-binding oxidoreductase n=1 Tax=Micromonospora sp. NPDC049171 TaxID=3155770 RepID=UPI00340D3BE0
MEVTRRGVLGGSAVLGGVVTAALVGAAPAPAARPGSVAGDALLTVRPGDPQYADLVRGVNQRWVGRPGQVVVATSTADVVRAVQQAARSGRRLSVRSGGHCFENFVSDPAVEVLLDLAGLDQIGFDPARRAFVVGAGARLEEVNRRLFTGWGVALPAGSCPSVGVGGHIAGGGYGPLSRLFGLTVDHLYAVEVVVADRSGSARAVLATREADDPNRELWWAHTGGGGGNFGVVTRYWFRSPGADTSDPRRLLPRPPAELLVNTVIWPWEAMDRAAFTRLLLNYSRWYAARNRPGRVENHLYSHLITFHRSGGAVVLNTQVSGQAPDADGLLDEFLEAIGDGVGVPMQSTVRRRLPWLLGTQWSGFADRPVGRRIKGKSALHRSAFTEAQAAAIHRALVSTDYTHPGSGVLIAPYGGQVSAVTGSATASSHRDAALILLYVSEWDNEAEDATHLRFLREFYRGVYASTGGVPVRDGSTAGAYINYPDVDLRDPAWNSSGTSWQELYYGENYKRLRRVKSQWDPLRLFHHQLSVEPAR